MSVKLIQTIVKNVIVTPKNHVGNFIFMTKLAISIVKELADSKRSITDT